MAYQPSWRGRYQLVLLKHMLQCTLYHLIMQNLQTEVQKAYTAPESMKRKYKTVYMMRVKTY